MTTQAIELQKGFYWLGAIDDELKVFDIIMETKYGTTYNAYLAKTTAGVVLFETVKERFFDSYIEKIKEVIGDLNQIKYLITNHTEPDHSGSIYKMVQLIPGLKVVGSKTAITYLKDIMNCEFDYSTAESLKSLTVGERKFEFISVPFLHWPDSMYTYMPNENILVTCDSFGSHYAPKKGIRMSELPANEEEGYQDALLYYYTAIFSPFKSYVIKGIEKIKDLKIDMICTGHGPVLDTRVQEIINTYKTWSTVENTRTRKLIVVPYVSAYGYTEELATAIKKGINEQDPSIEVKMYNINLLNYGENKDQILADFAEADGILLGTCTINGDALPFIWDLACSLNPIVHGGKVVSAFGSYGWSGEGVDNIMSRLGHLRMKVYESYKIKFRPSKKETESAIEYGKKFANAVVTGEVPETKKQTSSIIDYEAMNPTGKVCLWQCIVCGEIYKGVYPPDVCPACGVGQEMFILYEEEKVEFESTKPEKFVIIGSGAAAVNAADAIRQRNKVGSILLVTNDDGMPYYRPILSDLMAHDVPTEEFYLHTEAWYAENKIEFKFNTTVTKILPDQKKITTAANEEIAYDKIILANGSSPFTPPNMPGADLKGVFSIKYSKDALSVREYAKGKKNAVVIGGGALGIEAANALHELGLHISIIEFLPRLMPRQLDEDGSKFIETALKAQNVELFLGVATKAICGSNGVVTGVEVLDKVIPADVVIINIGVRSNIAIAKDAGIKTNRAVVVNEKMETSIPGIYAAGDVAECDNVCMCLWSPAIEQGKVAGANAAGDNTSFTGKIEPLSLMGFDSTLFTVGTYPTKDLETYEIVSNIDYNNKRLRKLYFKDNKLVYGCVFNEDSKGAIILNGVRNGTDSATILSQFFQ